MKRLLPLLAALAIAITSLAADKAFLGVVPDKSKSVEAQGFKGTGLLIKQVVAKGPAAQAGMKGGDVLTHFNGKLVEDGDDLSFFLRRARPGDKVTLEWVRGDARQKAAATLSARSEPEAVATGRSGLGKALDDTAFLGVGSLAINSNLLTYFGVTEGHGILIDAVVKGSPAERAGLKVGDILVNLDGRAVDSPGRLRRLMESYEPGAKVRLDLVRNRKPLVVDIVFSARDRSGLDELDMPVLPDLLGMPALPPLPELPSLEGLGSFPGRAAVESCLEVLRRLIGSPLVILEI